MSLTPRLDRLDKNYIINGGMDFWQRATSSTTVDSQYVADRFVPSTFGGQVTTTSRSSDIPNTNNIKYSYQVQVGTANVSPSSGQHLTIRHHIEGNDFLQIKGKTFTLGFWVKSSLPGIYSVVFGNASQDRSLIKEYTINAADTWEYKTITVLHDSSGSWSYDTGRGLSLTFALMAGSSYRFSPNSWQSVSALSSTSQVNFAATVGNIFRITGISLTEGDKALDFNQFVRAGGTFAQELTLCQRYYQTLIQSIAVAQNANTVYFGLHGRVPMRVASPAITAAAANISFYNGSVNTSGGNTIVVGGGLLNEYGMYCFFTVSGFSGLTAGTVGMSNTGGDGNVFKLDAEL